MVASTEDSLKHQSSSQGIEDTIGLWDASVLRMKNSQLIDIEVLVADQLLVSVTPVLDYQHEGDSTENVSNVAEHMTIVCKGTIGILTQVVEITSIKVARPRKRKRLILFLYKTSLSKACALSPSNLPGVPKLLGIF